MENMSKAQPYLTSLYTAANTPSTRKDTTAYTTTTTTTTNSNTTTTNECISSLLSKFAEK